MTDNDLDTLLSAPLAQVDDDGFTGRAAYRIAQERAAVRERRGIIEWSALLIAVALFLAAVPLTALMHAIETVTLDVSGSAPVAIALAALILTATFAHAVLDKVD